MCQIGKWAFCGMLVSVLGTDAPCWAQAPAQQAAVPSKAQAAFDRAAEAGKFTFLVFYKDDNPAVQKMVEVVKAGVQRRSDKAAAVFVQVTDPAEQPLVERFQAARSPMPLTLAVAANGAVTGIFSKFVTDEKIEEAIVTPTMTRCMKSLQENRLVFVCVQTAENPVVPAGLKDLQADPHFKERIVTVSMQLRDPAETRFLTQMQIDPQAVTEVTTVLLAPPGLMIGKYDANASADQIAAALHQAGKCCNDPNCKHNQSAAPQATRPNATRRK